MFFLGNWKPKLAIKRVLGRQTFTLQLHIEAVVTCPIFVHKNHVSTRPYSFLGHDPSGLRFAIERIVDELAERRDCESCGVTSVMPPQEIEKLKQQIAKRITPEWVASRVIELQKAEAA